MAETCTFYSAPLIKSYYRYVKNSSKEIALLSKFTPKPRKLDRLAKHILLNKLSNLKEGSIKLIEEKHSYQFGSKEPDSGLEPINVTITVKDTQFYGEVVFGGSIGAGEAFMQGYFECDNLTNLIRLMVRNQAMLDGIESGLASITSPIQSWLHRINKNTQQGSRKNISAHYDLGNDFLY